MKLHKFKNQLKSGSFARTNRFRVSFGIIQGQSDFWHYESQYVPVDDLKYMASAVNMPSKNLDSLDVKRYGAPFKVANSVGMDQVTVTFQCSEDMRERLFFEGWVDYIYGMDSKFKESLGSKSPSLRYNGLYNMKYYDDYITDMYIDVYAKDREVSEYQVHCFEAWPTNIGEVSLAYGDSEVATFSVTFTIRDWVATEAATTRRSDEEDEADDAMFADMERETARSIANESNDEKQWQEEQAAEKRREAARKEALEVAYLEEDDRRAEYGLPTQAEQFVMDDEADTMMMEAEFDSSNLDEEFRLGEESREDARVAKLTPSQLDAEDAALSMGYKKDIKTKPKSTGWSSWLNF